MSADKEAEAADKHRRQLQSVMTEIQSTEKTYNEDLRVLIDVFMLVRSRDSR